MRISRFVRPLVVGLLALLVFLPACNSAEESTLAQLMNSERSKAGIRTLVLDDNASAVARDWSATMARDGRIRHNPNLSSQITSRVGKGWRAYGENVGVNTDIRAMHRQFMASDGHRANILNRAYTRVGVGVVAKNGKLYTTVVFVGY
jgi:uncharacterized protein YkwD